MTQPKTDGQPEGPSRQLDGKATPSRPPSRQTNSTSSTFAGTGGLGGLDSIPGLGPIRARALKKAGFDSLERLRSANLQQISAVPGITEIKACQLMAFVRGETETDDPSSNSGPRATPTPRTPRAPTRPRIAGATGGRPGSQEHEAAPQRKPAVATQPRAAEPTEGVLPVAAEAAPDAMPIVALGEIPVVVCARRVAAAAGALLRTSNASSYDRPFARQIGKIAALAERIALDAPGPPAEMERAASPLRRVEQLLEEIAGVDSLGPKRQDRFAEALRDRRHKLLDTFLPTPAGPSNKDTAAATDNLKNEKGNKRAKKGHRGR